MPTKLVLSNGHLLVNIDEKLAITDFFFPYIGEENQLAYYKNIIFFRINGEFYSVSEKHWNITYKYKKETLIGKSILKHKDIPLTIIFDDFIHPKKRILIRDISIENNSSAHLAVNIYFQDHFSFYESKLANTVLWHPEISGILHYKKNRYVGCSSTEKIYQFSCDAKQTNKNTGAYPNLDSGELYFNPVSTGDVNSCTCLKYEIDQHSTQRTNYFYIAAESEEKLIELKKEINQTQIEQIKVETEHYWKNQILYPQNLNANLFFQRIQDFYKTSLLLIQTHIDANGAMIASSNSSTTKEGGKDTYSYLWPRDGSYVALALIECGYKEITKKYFDFCKKIISKDGFLSHRYFPSVKNLAIGSSWHPLVDPFGQLQLPIQEDETAITLYAVCKYYQKFKDTKFIEDNWDEFIYPMAEFLYNYRFNHFFSSLKDQYHLQKDVSGFSLPKSNGYANLENSNLPLPSFDLWEQYNGILTFTCASVFGALFELSRICKDTGKVELEKKYKDAAEEVKQNTIKYLFKEDLNRFLKMTSVDKHTGNFYEDSLIDASIYGVWHFGMTQIEDPKTQSTMEQIREHLTLPTNIGGIARNTDDHYNIIDKNLIGNPWVICTLWMAQYDIHKKDIKRAEEYIKWVMDHSDSAGLISEQIDPHSGFVHSLHPLAWSHSEFVRTINLLES